jgi:hypothetical protein
MIHTTLLKGFGVESFRSSCSFCAAGGFDSVTANGAQILTETHSMLED